jgi:hypothetical protein
MLALRQDPERGSPSQPGEISGTEQRTQSERAIVCAACAACITSPGHRVAMQGSHEHRFMNPGGFLFHIGCFAQAIGCVIVGPASREYPWFPAFAWRLALCGRCGVQLGWHFRNDEGTTFFGLVLDRLRDATLDS